MRCHCAAIALMSKLITRSARSRYIENIYYRAQGFALFPRLEETVIPGSKSQLIDVQSSHCSIFKETRKRLSRHFCRLVKNRAMLIATFFIRMSGLY